MRFVRFATSSLEFGARSVAGVVKGSLGRVAFAGMANS